MDVQHKGIITQFDTKVEVGNWMLNRPGFTKGMG